MNTLAISPMALDTLAVDFDGLADDMKHIRQSLTDMGAALIKATGVVILAYPDRIEAMMSLGKDWYNCAKVHYFKHTHLLRISYRRSVNIEPHDPHLRLYCHCEALRWLSKRYAHPSRSRATIAHVESSFAVVYLTDVLTPLLDENTSVSAKEVILGRYIEVFAISLSFSLKDSLDVRDPQTLKNDGTSEQQLSQGFVDARLELIEFSKNIQNVLSDSFIQFVLKERDQLVSDINRMDEEIKE